jgi:hypothetical protein
MSENKRSASSLHGANDQAHDDHEARSNIVGLYDLLYEIDNRLNPSLYRDHPEKATHD